MDEMKTFLEKVLPWDDPDAWHNLHYFYRPEDNRKVFTGRAFKDIDGLIKEARRALNNQRLSDLYICTSTQSMAEPKVSANGVAFNKAIRNQDNALAFKSFFIDLDIKPDTYPDAKAGMASFKQFRDAIKLPNPTVMVASGSGGYHIYWTLEASIPAAEWQPYASALALAAVKHDFKIDAACTIDAARVLRLPGTFNHKHDPKRPVTLTYASDIDVPFDDMKTALDPYVGEVERRPKTGTSAPYADDLGAGIYDNAPPIDLDSVAVHCPFIAEAITSAGNSHAEPLWDMAILTSTFTSGGVDDAHRMSSGHQDYTEEETVKRYERRLADREAKGLGWPQCQTIMLRGCTLCKLCPKLKLAKSPLNFGKYATAGTPHLNGTSYATPPDDMPNGYVRDADGLVYKITPAKDADDDDKRELVCTYPLVKGWVQTNPWLLHFYTKLSIKHHHQPVGIPIQDTGSQPGMVKTLGGQGIALTARHAKLLGEFLVNWIQKLREIKAAVITSTSFGWVEDRGKLSGFAFNGLVYGATGTTPAPMPDYQLAAQYTPKGEMQPWREAAKIFTDQHQPWINAILASSFAAPLVRLTGYRGFLMSCYSADTGIGKSTAVEVAQMVWGSSHGVQGLTDTHLQVAKRMGQLRSLPVYWDEIKTTKDAEAFVSTVFELSRGREKGRLKADTSMQAVGDWETLIVVASNDSMIDHVTRGLKTTAAGIVRVFEFTAKKSVTFKMDAGKAMRIVATARSNHGHAGVIYSEWLGKNIDRVTREVAQLDEHLRAKYKATEAERLWFGLLACVLLGLKYGMELGLLECTKDDLLQLKDYLLEDTLGEMRKQSSNQTVDLKKEVNVSEILSQFLRQKQARNTLVTDQVQALAGRPPLKGYTVLSKVDKLEELIVHHGVQQDIVRFGVSAFHTWLADKKYPVKVVVDAMMDTYGMRKSLGKLGAGTSHTWQVKAFFYEIQSTTLLSPKDEAPDETEQPTVAAQ